MVFYFLIFLVGIFLIIFLFIDIRFYSKRLNAFMSTTNGATNEIIRNKVNAGGFYSVVNTKTKELVDVYESRQDLLKNLQTNNYLNMKKLKNSNNLLKNSFLKNWF